MKKNEILHMQVRLFRLACQKWGLNNIECGELFDKYDVDEYIKESYEFFHIQGDETNLDDIHNYLKRKGVSLCREESREYTMQLLATMVIADRAEKTNVSTKEIMSSFRKSRTFEELFDMETGLWMNGPDCIFDEYDIELQSNRV